MTSASFVSVERPELAEVQSEVLLVEAELLAQLDQARLELHERLPHALHLLRRQRPALDAPHGLALHELAHEVDEREHERGQPLLDVLRVGVHAPPQGGPEAIEVGHATKLYGGQGPVQTRSSRAKASTRARNAPTS